MSDLIIRLGLIKNEREEFLEFWIPRIKALNSPYIFVSILEKDEKERIDKVFYSPEPDTRIEFIAYFKPLDFPIAIDPLILPKRPERIGFTAVEWGGVIDNNSGTYTLK